MIHLSITKEMVNTLSKVLQPNQGFNLDGSLLSSSNASSSLTSAASLGGHQFANIQVHTYEIFGSYYLGP